jgi:hypothetical protein
MQNWIAKPNCQTKLLNWQTNLPKQIT